MQTGLVPLQPAWQTWKKEKRITRCSGFPADGHPGIKRRKRRSTSVRPSWMRRELCLSSDWHSGRQPARQKSTSERTNSPEKKREGKKSQKSAKPCNQRHNERTDHAPPFSKDRQNTFGRLVSLSGESPPTPKHRATQRESRRPGQGHRALQRREPQENPDVHARRCGPDTQNRLEGLARRDTLWCAFLPNVDKTRAFSLLPPPMACDTSAKTAASLYSTRQPLGHSAACRSKSVHHSHHCCPVPCVRVLPLGSRPLPSAAGRSDPLFGIISTVLSGEQLATAAYHTTPDSRAEQASTFRLFPSLWCAFYTTGSSARGALPGIPQITRTRTTRAFRSWSESRWPRRAVCSQ